jgi:hypothetical protein
MNPFQSLREYEQFIYALPQTFSSIAHSTLVVIQRGRHFAELTGELTFANQCRLVVYERLMWQDGPLAAEGYSYEVWCGSRKLFWYDSQPHPDDPALANTKPHHKHIPPNIKHHRIPAPDLSLSKPNLPFLISEVETLTNTP